MFGNYKQRIVAFTRLVSAADRPRGVEVLSDISENLALPTRITNRKDFKFKRSDRTFPIIYETRINPFLALLVSNLADDPRPARMSKRLL